MGTLEKKIKSYLYHDVSEVSIRILALESSFHEVAKMTHYPSSSGIVAVVVRMREGGERAGEKRF